MSSVFRNLDDDSDGGLDGKSSAEASYDKPPINSKNQKDESAIEPGGVNALQSKVSGSLARLGGSTLPNLEARHHSTLFYLSLIEGRCRTQAANTINKERLAVDQVSEHDPEVLELAQHLFSEISKELYRAGVLPDEFAGQNLEKLRAQYLNSFDRILDNIALKRTQENSKQNTFTSVENNSHLISFNNNSTSFNLHDALAVQHLTMASPREHLPGLSSFMLTGESNYLVKADKSTYDKEYKEICMLGRGAFGAVYQVHNHVDDQEYAIKKITIPASDLRSVNGPEGLRKMLLEVRTLARLTHHNVVRYYHGWLEYVPAAVRKAIEQDMSRSFISGIKMQSLSLEEQSIYQSQLRELDLADDRNDYEEHSDPFERSQPSMPKITFKEPARSSGFAHNSESMAGPIDEPSSFAHSSSDIEEVSRNTAARKSLEPEGDVVLYIKMAVHPLTLEDFIWGQGDSGIRHCFHSQICVRILLGILDGLQYIHDEGIIHRDLKPSNIFLSIRKGPASDSESTIDITGCYKCGVIQGSHTFITPHIGDFGLAAEVKGDQLVAHGEDNIQPMALAMVSSQHRQVGTKFYCPPILNNDKTICAKFDIYSLGIIAFELCTKFGTKSERMVVLERLSKEVFPAEFEKHELAEGVKGMLCTRREDRWNCTQVRKWLRKIKEGFE